MKKTTIIFDLDGTLLYTLDDLRDCLNSVFTKYGLPNVSTEDVRVNIGKGAVYLVEHNYNFTDKAFLDEVANSYISAQAKWDNAKTKLYDGLDEVLKTLKKDGYKIAILSNKPDKVTQVVYKELLSEYNFDFVVGNIPEKFKPKPDKSCIDYCLTNLHISPDEAIYVGDSDVDVLTAKAGNIDVIGVLWGYRDKNQLEEVGCTCFVDNTNKLLEKIKSF